MQTGLHRFIPHLLPDTLYRPLSASLFHIISYLFMGQQKVSIFIYCIVDFFFFVYHCDVYLCYLFWDSNDIWRVEWWHVCREQSYESEKSGGKRCISVFLLNYSWLLFFIFFALLILWKNTFPNLTEKNIFLFDFFLFIFITFDHSNACKSYKIILLSQCFAIPADRLDHHCLCVIHLNSITLTEH